jgi:hypothetical protein
MLFVYCHFPALRAMPGALSHHSKYVKICICKICGTFIGLADRMTLHVFEVLSSYVSASFDRPPVKQSIPEFLNQPQPHTHVTSRAFLKRTHLCRGVPSLSSFFCLANQQCAVCAATIAIIITSPPRHCIHLTNIAAIVHCCFQARTAYRVAVSPSHVTGVLIVGQPTCFSTPPLLDSRQTSTPSAFSRIDVR